MIRNLFPLGALLLGSALLLFAGGLNGLILPIRGEIEGFTAASLGLLGTGWALGYVLGCLFTPWLVKRVGHVRSFGAMCAIAAITVLASLLFLTPWVWIPLRGLAGFCFAGAAMVVESWLNDKADNASRGRIFGVYTMVNLGATTAGQLIITLGIRRAICSSCWPPWSIAWRFCRPRFRPRRRPRRWSASGSISRGCGSTRPSRSFRC